MNGKDLTDDQFVGKFITLYKQMSEYGAGAAVAQSLFEHYYSDASGLYRLNEIHKRMFNFSMSQDIDQNYTAFMSKDSASLSFLNEYTNGVKIPLIGMLSEKQFNEILLCYELDAYYNAFRNFDTYIPQTSRASVIRRYSK